MSARDIFVDRYYQGRRREIFVDNERIISKPEERHILEIASKDVALEGAEIHSRSEIEYWSFSRCWMLVLGCLTLAFHGERTL
jgi:hypothetical protein